MDNDAFQSHYNRCLSKLDNFQRYFDYDYKVFYGLRTTVFEISHCLMLELYKSSITLTNYWLERLLKMALIDNEVGLKPIPIDQWNDIFEKPNKNYNSINLSTTIDYCLKNSLITQPEKDFLYTVIREQIRNGFSHADSNKILSDIPEQMSGYHGSFDGSQELRKVSLNQKLIPSIQSALIDDFAKNNALNYFEFVFELMRKIEGRLKDKN